MLDAGACDTTTTDNGESCTIGFCEDTGSPCSTSSDCNSGAACQIGYCHYSEFLATEPCDTDLDCAAYGSSHDTCSTTGYCERQTSEACSTVSDCSSPSGEYPSCVTAAKTQAGTCVNNNCLATPADDNNDGKLDPFNFDDAEALTCRAWPETKAPFPNTVVKTWVNGASGSQSPESNVSVGANPDDQTENSTKPFQTLSTFEDVTLCMAGEDCACNYDKVTYGSTVRYYGQGADNATRRVCSGGTYDGVVCVTDEGDNDDYNVLDTTCSDNGGSCQFITSQQSLIGMQGFCLQRDTALTMNGDPNQAPCLAWLPIDRASGATDLYGKSAEAGYPLTDTFMCAQEDLYYDASISNDFDSTGTIACASNSDTTCSQESDWEDQLRCNDAVSCPSGYYAILSRCIYDSGDDSDGGSNSAAWCDDQENASCPFVCVPEESTHDDGTACDNPIDLGTEIVLNNTTRDSLSGVDVYKMEFDAADDFDSYITDNYQDCKVRGIDYTSDEMNPLVPNGDFDYFGETNNIGSTCFGEACPNGYFSLLFDQSELYPACTVLAQVASTDDNRAWTDRLLFEGDGGAFTIDPTIGGGDDFSQLHYTKDTERTPFGSTASVDEIESAGDPSPAHVLSCFFQTLFTVGDDGDNYTNMFALPTIDGSCADYVGSADGTDPQARAYTSGYGLETDDSTFTTDGGTPVLSYEVVTDANDRSEYQAIENGSAQSIMGRMTQGFAKALAYFIWSPDEGIYGGYGDATATSGYGLESYDDITASGDGVDVPSAPVVRSVSSTCVGSYCREGADGKFTVNGEDSNDLTGAGGTFFADLKFFVEANPNQLPIRRVIVDWADETGGDYSGSITGDNYYKNRRGLDSTNSQYCDNSTADNWGETTDACDSNYFNAQHYFTCSQGFINTLPSCSLDADGKLAESPCTTDGESCTYQPRVHIRDNWGWCTGTCPGGTDGTNGCYDGDGDISSSDSSDQCNFETYPNIDYPTVDPWVYYDGVITIEP